MSGSRELAQSLDAAVRDALAAVRAADADAGAELAELRRRRLTRPSVVLVGETKRGKSSLVNALLGVPGLSPVDAAVATAAYLHFTAGATAGAAAYVPGLAEPVDLDLSLLGAWATGRGGPDGGRAPRRIEITHPAPLLQYVSLLDTPGVGGLDPAHTAVALDAVERATALLFVADASAPLSQPELEFLVSASERVDTVVFALTKVDAYPGWRRIAEDNRALLRARAPRFADAPWFPVSARLAELALAVPAGEQAALVDASHIAELQHALVELAGRGHQLQLANVLRSARGELARLEQAAQARVQAAEADPAETARVRAERSALAARKRTESRQWALLLSTETQRARVETVGLLRTRIAALQADVTARIEQLRGDGLAALPDQVDTELEAVAVRLSDDLRATFRQVGERVLAQVFDDEELAGVLDRLNATLRHALAAGPPRDGSGDNLLIAMSAGGIAFMAGRGAIFGASVFGVGGAVAGGLLIPVAGLGLGLAAGGYVLYRRRVQTDRQQARAWLRDVLSEARAALQDEISYRFTDLQYALSVAVDDAVERRLRELDEHIAEIDAAAAEDAAGRARRRSRATAELQQLRAQLRNADEVLDRARALAPVPASIGQENA
ncbi:dynamin family protein [Pseudosporangium ferrugineum]|uniref:50S ribosome-binding GTPase n=1 Tax=Pseudosporangium ferrugineum TaxID=439699 RepID=A0A2T0SHE8_9ACTN|nr:dynamin family protein [Pseudosporangium ferrugineum]PRY32844.1 50S ribosome-binding GTPase [Pseudosporangium ferrugineum]